MFYVLFSRDCVVGYTDSKESLERVINSPYAYLMGYTYEVRPNRPQFLDKF